VRYAKRVDANHGDIRDGLRGDGYIVEDLSHVGHGVSDLAVQSQAGWPPTLWVEVKDGDKPPSARKLTPDEEKFKQLVGPDRYRVVTSLINAREVCLEYFHKPLTNTLDTQKIPTGATS
jgi:hypothetical protein